MNARTLHPGSMVAGARVRLVGTLLAGWLAGTLAIDAAEEADETVMLPPLLIEERTAPVPWRYLALPGRELLSACSAEVTEEFARRCWRLERMLREILPERFQFQTSIPEIHLLFNEDLSRARSQEVMREMLSRDESTADSADAILKGRPLHPPSLAPWLPQRRIQFLPNLRLGDLDVTAVFAATSGERVDQMQGFTFVEDRIRYLLVRRVPALPDWFVAGMVELYRQSHLYPNRIEIDPCVWISEERTRALRRDPDCPRPLLPLREMLSHRAPEAGAAETELDALWRSQCALFLRWVLVEDAGARRDALWTLVERLHTQPLDEGMFRELFGLGFADARDILSDYLPIAVERSARLESKDSTPPPELKAREATELEIARLRGDWERLQIPYVKHRFPQAVGRYVDQARQTLNRAYERGQRDPALLALIGLTECDAGNPAAGRAYLEAAARAHVPRPRVYLELAKMRFDQLGPIRSDAKINRAEADSVMEPIRIGAALSPALADFYGLAAEILAHRTGASAPEELDWLNAGAAQFAKLSPLVLRVAALNFAHGRRADAAQLIRLGLLHARDPAEQQRLERALARITPLKRE